MFKLIEARTKYKKGANPMKAKKIPAEKDYNELIQVLQAICSIGIHNGHRFNEKCSSNCVWGIANNAIKELGDK